MTAHRNVDSGEFKSFYYLKRKLPEKPKPEKITFDDSPLLGPCFVLLGSCRAQCKRLMMGLCVHKHLFLTEYITAASVGFLHIASFTYFDMSVLTNCFISYVEKSQHCISLLKLHPVAHFETSLSVMCAHSKWSVISITSTEIVLEFRFYRYSLIVSFLRYVGK